MNVTLNPRLNHHANGREHSAGTCPGPVVARRHRSRYGDGGYVVAQKHLSPLSRPVKQCPVYSTVYACFLSAITRYDYRDMPLVPGTIIAARSADVGPCVGRDVRSSVFASRRASCQARPLALCSSGPDDEITGPTQPATGGSRHGHGQGQGQGTADGRGAGFARVIFNITFSFTHSHTVLQFARAFTSYLRSHIYKMHMRN